MNLFDLVAKITLDTTDYEANVRSVEKSARGIGDKLKSGLATGAKLTAAGIAAAGTATAAFVKQSIESYSSYEQLVGGVETLFGNSAQKVMSDASAAFKTAGMSMNDYMETSIQSAASLINSLGGDQEKAADLMNMSIVDMADNVNKMGTSMDAVQNAYRGFSRGNFTMLDNLALGFAGTKEGMQELLDKAQEISGIEYDISSYSDIVEAIHVVQTEMGITGTTAKEASETISGSLAATKSAWQNLITGLSDSNADINSLVGKFVGTIETTAKNLLPTVNTAIKGVGKMVRGLAPTIAAAVSMLATDVLPELLQSGAVLLSEVASSILDSVPELLSASVSVIQSLAEKLSQNIGPVIDTVTRAIGSISKILTDPQTISTLLNIGTDVLVKISNGITNALPTLLNSAMLIIRNIGQILIENMPALLEVSAKIIRTLSDGLAVALPTLIPQIVDTVIFLVNKLIENADKLVDAAMSIIIGLAEGLIVALPALLEKAPEIVLKLVSAIVDNAPKMWTAASKIVAKLLESLMNLVVQLLRVGEKVVSVIWDGIKSMFSAIVSWGKKVIDKIISGFSGISTAFLDVGRNIVYGIWDGISSVAGWLYDKAKGFASGIVDSVTGFLGIASPSKVFAEIGRFTAMGLGVGFESEFDRVERSIQRELAELTDSEIELNGSLGMSGISTNAPSKPPDATTLAVEQSMNRIEATLNKILDNLGFDVVLDDGTLVGRIDKSLGVSAMRKIRGNA